MAKHAKTVNTAAAFRASKPTGDSASDKSASGFKFGWEGLSVEPLMYEARAIVDNVWPNTETPDVVIGVWDETPIMQAVLVALRRGIEIGKGDTIASA